MPPLPAAAYHIPVQTDSDRDGTGHIILPSTIRSGSSVTEQCLPSGGINVDFPPLHERSPLFQIVAAVAGRSISSSFWCAGADSRTSRGNDLRPPFWRCCRMPWATSSPPNPIPDKRRVVRGLLVRISAVCGCWEDHGRWRLTNLHDLKNTQRLFAAAPCVNGSSS